MRRIIVLIILFFWENILGVAILRDQNGKEISVLVLFIVFSTTMSYLKPIFTFLVFDFFFLFLALIRMKMFHCGLTQITPENYPS